MRLGIKSFSIGILVLLISIMYFLFARYYFQQQEAKAEIIVQSIQTDLSELSYILSRHVQKEPIRTARAILDRKAANNEYAEAIAIFDDNELLMTTDPSFSKTMSSSDLFIADYDSMYHILTKHKALRERVHYYERSQLKEYTLLFFIDQKSIERHFSKLRENFILLFVFIPLLILSVLGFIIHRIIAIPLEKLRQYAYYQSDVPKKCILKEFEYIRSSMVQTFARLDKEKKDLYTLARTDSLSGLANRNLLEERAEQVIEQCQRHNAEFALLFLDLDNFKAINDSLGHNVGDELLKNIAGTIKDTLRLNDVVSRIGGDEFIILLTDYADDIELIQIIDRIQTRLMQPWQIQTYPVRITSSIGISVYPKDGGNLLSLMKNADIAMYQAKDNGRSQHHFFTEELNQRTQELIALTNSMQEALQKDEYLLYYQPQNDAKTGEIIGAEALLRWIHPEKGMIPPVTFIPTAEENGFIIELGKWILESAIRQKKEWEDKGIDIKISINIAAKQIQQKDFVDTLKNLFEKYQINSSNITLEITEHIFLHNSGHLLKKFTAIKEMGPEISLDDFGTGYSSLSYLKTYPIDVLKIDKAFIDDCNSEDGAVFVETIIKMAQTLRLKVVAEGVELAEQLNYLKTMNCDFYQGYLCSKPVEAEAFENLYKQQTDGLR